MRAHWLQHVPFEGLGSIESWLTHAGYEISVTRFFELPQMPDVRAVDFLVVMGGPMSVNQEQEFSWLAKEKAFIKQAVYAGKPVLGVCLGAQLIAAALGADVFPNPDKEIGWFPIQRVPIPAGTGTVFCFPEQLDVFHWHGQTFDLPPQSVWLAQSAGCQHQAFQWGRATLGMQFHLEMTPEAVRELVRNARAELSPSRFVQSEDQLLAEHTQRYAVMRLVLDDILSFLQRAADVRR